MWYFNSLLYKYVILNSLLFDDDVTVVPIFFKTITMVKVIFFVGGVVFVVMFSQRYVLRARHDHNKIAPCGMIKVF